MEEVGPILNERGFYFFYPNISIQTYVELGQRGMAIQQFKSCKEILENELGMSPSPKTIEIFERLKFA